MTDEEHQRMANEIAAAHDVASDRVWRTVRTIISHKHFTAEEKIASLQEQAQAVETQRRDWSRESSTALAATARDVMDVIEERRTLQDLAGDDTTMLDLLIQQLYWAFAPPEVAQ